MYREAELIGLVLYFTTVKQGFSFMTCHSREHLSFKIFLNPFKLEVWIVLLLTMVVVGIVFVVILISQLNWECLEAILFSQLGVILIVLDKSADIKSENRSNFGIQVLIWVVGAARSSIVK